MATIAEEVDMDADTMLLRISRAAYHDLLADHPEMAIGMPQGLARRIRPLVA